MSCACKVISEALTLELAAVLLALYREYDLGDACALAHAAVDLAAERAERDA